MPTDWQLETETTIRWDRTGDPATLWTADRHVAVVWRRRGYDVREDGQGTWRCEVPKRAITFRSLRLVARRPGKGANPGPQAAFVTPDAAPGPQGPASDRA